jgi:hypothetical protein
MVPKKRYKEKHPKDLYRSLGCLNSNLGSVRGSHVESALPRICSRGIPRSSLISVWGTLKMKRNQSHTVLASRGYKHSWTERNKLIRCGKYLCSAARVVYDVIDSYRPSYPSLKRLQIESGLSRDTVLYGIYVLTLKGVIRRASGRGGRKNNRYYELPEVEWNLLESPLPAREWQKQRSNRKTSRSPTVGLTSSPTVGQELDQKKIDQFNSDTASRLRCPMDRSEALDREIEQIRRERQKGVRLPADNIGTYWNDPNTLAQIAARQDREELVEGENLPC